MRKPDPFLRNDIAIIGSWRHVMKGNTGFFLAFYEHPVDRAPASIFGKKRPVEVEATNRRDLQYGWPDHFAVVERKDNVRLQFLDLSNPHGMVDILGGKDRDVPGCSKLRDGIKPDVFLWIIHVSEDRSNLKPVS